MFHVKHKINDYEIVLKILLKVLSGKNLNEIFNQNITNQQVNISKVKNLCYGVMRQYFILNWILNSLAKNKPTPKIAIILLIAIYEIKYTKKPVYAITNDLVELSFELTKNIKIKGFVNGIIRNFLRQQVEIETKLSTNQEYKYNLPIWMINKIKKDYPNNWNNIIDNLNKNPKISLRINFKKININEYTKYLDKEDINYKIINNIIIFENTLAIEKIPLFKNGYVSIQDLHAQKLIEIIKLKNDEYVLDSCSAPGGKACQILENNQINLLALDIDAKRLDKVRQNLSRLNLTAKTLCADASNLLWWDKKKFDTIIADVPCSASGTIKRNPDIKFHRKATDIKNFVHSQKNIILNLWQCLKDNGHLVYITCSIFKEENQNNINFFRQELANVQIINELQLLPDENGDGFYYCILKKVAN